MKKKLLVILGIFIIILLFAVYLLYNYRKDVIQMQSFNRQYEVYYEKTISTGESGLRQLRRKNGKRYKKT